MKSRDRELLTYIAATLQNLEVLNKIKMHCITLRMENIS